MDTPPTVDDNAHETKARRYFRGLCWPDEKRHCVKCGAVSPYALKSGRLRCAGCGYTFHDFSGRFINIGNLPFAAWLKLLELFAAEETAKTIAARLGVSYNTAYKAVSNVRMAILAHALDASVLLGPQSGLDLQAGKAKNSGVAPRSPVFGIVEERGFAFADYLPDFSLETILHFKLNFMLRTSRLGGIVFTGRYRNYSTLVCCPGDEIESGYLGADDNSAPFDRDSEFWAYARKRITKFHGVTRQRFPFYLKELEFRFNHRNQDIMPVLAQYVCGFVPKLD